MQDKNSNEFDENSRKDEATEQNNNHAIFQEWNDKQSNP